MYSTSFWDLCRSTWKDKTNWTQKDLQEKERSGWESGDFLGKACVKEFYPKRRVDYEDTLMPLAILKSIRILLSIVAYYEYEIWAMDLKMIFLNGHLEENTYMV